MGVLTHSSLSETAVTRLQCAWPSFGLGCVSNISDSERRPFSMHGGRPRLPRPTLICACCGQGWQPKHLRTRYSKYCSRQCALLSRPKPDAVQRFWSKVDKSGTCWFWTAGRSKPLPYGKFFYAGRTVGAHRFAYEITFGPVPGGLDVLHHCDIPLCVRPDHLYVGTDIQMLTTRGIVSFAAEQLQVCGTVCTRILSAAHM